MADIVLSFDVGTQSVRGSLIDSEGNFLDYCQEKYQPAYIVRKPNWAEQRPDYYYEVICRISKTLKTRNPKIFKNLKGMTITCFRDSVICLDENNKPLRDMILWLDQRKAEYRGDFGWFYTILFKLVNMYDTAVMQYEMSFSNWIRQNEPEVWEKTKHYVFLSTYLNYLITGRLADCPANQTGHIPMDYKTSKWLKKGAINTRIFNIPTEMLCELVDQTGDIGVVSAKAAKDSGIPEGLRFISSGPDKACETLGLSVNKPGKAAISLGTAASIAMSSKHYFEPRPFLPSYPSVIPGVYTHDVQIYRGYWMVSWFKEQFCAGERMEAQKRGIKVEELLDERLDDIPPGSDGLLVHPYWQAGLEAPNAHGTIMGYTERHTKAHLYRAMIEGINFGLMKGLRIMEKRSSLPKVEVIYVGGGAATNSKICQITADMFGMPVVRIHTNEASGLGAAISCFVSLGVYENYDEAINKMVRVLDRFNPDPDQHQLYEKIYKEVYCHMEKNLGYLDNQIKKITKGR